MATNPDFRDLFSALSAEGAEVLIADGHAVMFHAGPLTQRKELCLWVRPSPANAERVYRALATFGAPMADLTTADLATPGTTFQIGIAPNRVDVVTSIDGVAFDEAWAGKTASSYDGAPIFLLGFDELLKNKRAVGRPQDLLDVAWLERSRPKR